jgi:hypothetical protein
MAEIQAEEEEEEDCPIQKVKTISSRLKETV